MIRNFVIAGTQRTGSTALYRAVNLHPAIACGREWVTELPRRKKLAAAQSALQGDFSELSLRSRELIEKKYSSDTKWLGFKVLFRSSNKWLVHPRFSLALWQDRLEDYLRWLSKRPDIRVIHIVRTDPVEWLKSKFLAGKTGLFTVTPYPEGTRIRIPIGEAIKRLKAKDWVDSRLSTLESTNPYLRVNYEDFLHSNHQVIVKVVQFLECDPAALGEIDYKKQKKQSKGSAENYISNYNELLTALRKHNLSGDYFRTIDALR